MAKIEIKELIESGVHFGHLTRKWNPNMSPYIYIYCDLGRFKHICLIIKLQLTILALVLMDK